MTDDSIDRIRNPAPVEASLSVQVSEIERLRAALNIARIMVHDEPIAHALYSNGRTLIQILDLALASEQKVDDNGPT